MSVEELLISLSTELLSSTTILRPGRYSVNLGKIWISSGEGRSETTAILSFQVNVPPSTAKQRAIARVFSDVAIVAPLAVLMFAISFDLTTALLMLL